MPRVSVIIPTYNRARYLGEAIASVRRQTVSDYEIIVVDDGSTDDTHAVITAHGATVRYIYRDHCGLPGVVRNHGLRAAAGAYIAFLDADDLWMPNKLEVQLALAERQPHLGMLYSDAVYFDDASGRDRYRCHQVVAPAPSGWIGPYLLLNCCILLPTTLVRRSVLDDVGLFSEDPVLRWGEDWDLWLRVAARHQISYQPEVLARVRLHEGNMTRAEDPMASHYRGLMKIQRMCALAPDVYEPVRQRALFGQYSRTIQMLAAQGRASETRALFAQAVRIDPQMTLQLFREVQVMQQRSSRCSSACQNGKR